MKRRAGSPPTPLEFPTSGNPGSFVPIGPVANNYASRRSKSLSCLRMIRSPSSIKLRLTSATARAEQSTAQL